MYQESWYILIPLDTSQYLLIHLDSSWYLSIPLDTFLYLLIHLIGHLLLFPNFLVTDWLTDSLKHAISRGAFATKNLGGTPPSCRGVGVRPYEFWPYKTLTDFSSFRLAFDAYDVTCSLAYSFVCNDVSNLYCMLKEKYQISPLLSSCNGNERLQRTFSYIILFKVTY